MSSHEDIRYHIIRKLRKAILEVIQEIGEKEPELYYKLGLEEYRKIIGDEKEEYVPLIIKNERFLKGIGRSDIEVFGGKILIEVEVKDSDFPIAFKQLQNYISFYPDAEYCIITNDNRWIIYDHSLKEIKELKDIIKELKEEIIKPILIKGIKIIPSTENIRKLFHSIMLYEDDLLEIFRSNDIKSSALFKAYNNIITRLYEGISENIIELLYIKHTLMQMIVSACLTTSLKKIANSIEACSGEKIEIEIVLPYLKWWETLLKSEDSNVGKVLNSLLDSIYSKALLIDWEKGKKEDVFRELYEILIDFETRRKLGEYYTPLWLVEYMINNVSQELKDKVILDPFCGSGTFLVSAFYKKIQEGEEAEKAIKEIIGFDINPLAVSIARAELMIAYQKVKGEIITPLIFNTDSANILLCGKKWQPISFLDELKELEVLASIESDIFERKNQHEVDFSEILTLEMILREYFKDASKSEKIKEKIEENMLKLKNGKWGGVATNIIKVLIKKESIDAISKLIGKYKNGVWAVSVTSLFAPYIIRNTKVDIVITNPPWVLLSSLKGSYGNLIRKEAKKVLESYKKIGQILVSSDLASVLLYGCLELSKGEVAFLMPKEVVYTSSSYYGVGKILTYNIIKNYNAKIVELNFDAFEHGRIASIVFLEKRKITKENIKIYSMDIKFEGKYSKFLPLSKIEPTIKEREENYDEYINRVIEYTTITPKSLKETLNVKEVFPMGDYIRGLFGGEKKKGVKKYAGLIFEVKRYDNITKQYIIKLWSLNKDLKISKHFLNPYWKKLIYIGRVYPFYFNGEYDVLLSSKGEDDLKEFLKKYIVENLSGEEKDKVKILIEELKQPSKLNSLKENMYYTIYRRSGTFSSFVLTPEDILKITKNGAFEIVVESDCSFISVTDKIKAYYYSAILNYLAYKVIEKSGAFERHQYLRPLISIHQVSLEWKNEEWQNKIAELSEKLHEITPKYFSNIIRKGMQVKECFKILQQIEEFKEIVRIIDNEVDKDKLLEAIKRVSRIK